MLRLVQVGNALPISYPVDPTATFSPGYVGQLRLYGNNIVCGVSDGTAPFGIIDDTQTSAFYAPSTDEVVIEPAVGQIVGGKYVSVVDVKAELKNPNVVENSFVCSVRVLLKARNGVITFPAGTELNFDSDGDGIVDSIRAICSYTYQIPNMPGDSSVQGSGRVTLHFMRMIIAVDTYETTQRYPLNAPLFVSEAGLFTTRQSSTETPTIGIVLGPPTSRDNFLTLLWL